jgi:hypothetical protein
MTEHNGPGPIVLTDDRHQNGTGISALPPWMRFITIVGLPTAAAAFLIYWNTVDLSGRIERMAVQIDQHVVATEQLVQLQREQVRLNRLVCLHTATTDDQKSRCLQ